MKILILIPDYPPEVLGGTQLFTEDLAKNLAKNHEVKEIQKQVNIKSLEDSTVS